MFFTLFCAMAVEFRPIANIIKSTSCFIRNKFYKFGLGAKIQKDMKISKDFL